MWLTLIPLLSPISKPVSTANFISGATPTAITKILGAQAIGKGAVDKRVDVIAAMITMHATLEDLKELELCYSACRCAGPANAKRPAQWVSAL